MTRRKILIVDDTPDIREFLLQTLTSGYDIVETSVPATARQILTGGDVDALVIDVGDGDADAEALITWTRNHFPDGPVVIAIKDRSAETSARLVRLGAYDFIDKPFTIDRLIHSVERAFEYRYLHRENDMLHSQLRANDPVAALIGESDAAADLREKVRVLSSTDTPFWIQGEKGSGKKLFAREVHRLSGRAEGPFVSIRCASAPVEVLTAELFGEERKASGTARVTTPGRIEMASGGTVLLEDIDKLPLDVCAKIATLVRDGHITRVGGSGHVGVDVRIIAASCEALERLSEQARFDVDLFETLNVVPIRTTPLRERRDDIPRLVQYFVKHAATESGRASGISEEAVRALTAGYWRGNVGELRNTIERAHIFAAGGNIDIQHLQLDNGSGQRLNHMEHTFRQGSIREMEKLMIIDRLDATDQNRTQAAKTLDISVRTLRNKLREYRESGTPSLVGVSPRPDMANKP